MGKHIAFIVIDGFADWEHAQLSAAARGYFKGTTSFHSPGGKPVTSIGGMTIAPDAIEDLDPQNYDALVVIGSETWMGADAPDISPALRAADEAGKVVGAICAATLAASRAGLLDSRRHTSNALEFIQENAKEYRAWDLYVATPAAKVTGAEVLRALYPEHAEGLEQYKAMCAAELAA